MTLTLWIALAVVVLVGLYVWLSLIAARELERGLREREETYRSIYERNH